jgi:sugar phosphate permease
MELDIDASQVKSNLAKPTRQRVVLSVILFIGVFVAYMDRSNVSVLVADAGFLTDMGIEKEPLAIGMIMTSYLIAFGVSSMIAPPLISFLGPRKAMVMGIVVWAMSLAIGAMAPTFTAIILSRILLGIGEGASYPQSAVFIKNWIPPQERGRANTAWVVGQSLSLAATTPIIAIVIALVGWRESYWFLLAATVVPLYLFWFHTKDTPREHKRINALELEHIERGLASESAGTPGPSEHFRDRFMSFAGKSRYWMLVFWFMLINFSSFGMQTWLPSYLKVTRGFSWGAMGVLASLPFVFVMLFKIGTGWLTDKIGRRSVILFLSFGSLMATACIFTAVTTTNNYVSAILMALGYGLSGMGNAVVFVLVQDIVPEKAIGSAIGFLTGAALLFASLSPAILGYAIKLGNYDTGLFFLVGSTGAAALISFVLSFFSFRSSLVQA